MLWWDAYLLCFCESNAPFPPLWSSRVKWRIVLGGVTFDGDVFLTRWVLVISLRLVFPLSVSRRPILISSGFLWLLPLLEVGQPPLLLLWRENWVASDGLEHGARQTLLRCKIYTGNPVQELLDHG